MEKNPDLMNDQEMQEESAQDVLTPITEAENAPENAEIGPENDFLDVGEQPVVPAGESEEEGAQEAQEDEPVAPSAAERRRRVVSRAAGRINNSERSSQAVALHQLRREASAPMERKHVYRGKVIAAQPAQGSTPSLVRVQLGDTGLYTVISYADFFDPDPLRTDNLSADARANREVRLLNNTWGANVPFIITHMIEGDDNAVMIRASRKDALPVLQRINYFSSNDNNNIRQGRIVSAEILSVDGAGHTMWVELGGVEQRLLPSMITYRPIVEAADLHRLGYASGKRIPVCGTFGTGF